MSIPVPDLDDRTFQQLVDDAKRRIADRCPEWTDHNVSDPGVTLVELFASMTEEVIYRVNRLPASMLLTFMDLVGMRLEPGRPARTGLTFWLTAPTRLWEGTDEDVHVVSGPGVEVGTERVVAGDPPIGFRTTTAIALPRAEVVARYRAAADAADGAEPSPVDATDVVVFGTGVPQPGAAFLLELARPLPGCAVKLDLICEPNVGSGIDPDDPPWAWEAWVHGTWQRCEVDRDTTGGLNRNGAVYLHVPVEDTETGLTGTSTSGWLRCRVDTPRPDQGGYDASPVVGAVTAQTIGVTVPATQVDVEVRDEVIGVSDGSCGQPPFQLRQFPVVDDGAGGPVLVAGDDPEPWRPVPDLRDSSEDDRHYLLDPVAGQIRLGVAVRQTDGRVRRHGRIPPAGAVLRIARYGVSGGTGGNVRATAVRVARSPLPGIRRVENRHPAVGGVDPETVEQAVTRLPIFLRRRDRAVTIADFAEMARDSDPGVARSHALPSGDSDTSVGVRVVVVPDLPQDVGETAPVPERRLTDVPELLSRVARHLDDRRMVGIRVLVSPPRYVAVQVRTRLRAIPSADRHRVERAATAALFGLLHPLLGGDDGTGWPFGTDLQVGDVYAALQRVPGVERVEQLTLHDADGTEVPRLEVPPNGLPLGLSHVVEIR